MHIFANYSIKNKIILGITSISTIALLVTTILLAVNEIGLLRATMLEDSQTFVQILSSNIIPSLVFNDQESLQTTLSTLEINKSIRYAIVYDKIGEVFAQYVRKDIDSSLFSVIKSSRFQTNHYQFQSDKLILFQQIIYNKQELGVIYIESDLRKINELVTRYIATVLLISSIAIFIAFFLATRLQAYITRPILHLAKTAFIVTQKADYTLRAQVHENDEIGQLVHDFNCMLEQIQIRDIALQKAKEIAETANRSKSTFLANMSHELRTPLNAIIGFSQLMLRNHMIPQEEVENLSIINRSGEHLLGLINDILELSKIEAGKITLNEQNFDLHYLLKGIEEMFLLKAKDKEIQLLVEYPPELPQYICADEGKLRQILINLLSNAIKFTQEGGVTLRLNWQYSQPKMDNKIWLHIEVEDTGIGISEKEIDSLFQAFIQTASGKQVQEGTGLGLAISKSFVHLMGGKLSVTSQLGQGTVFKFKIPIQLAEASQVTTHHPTRTVVGLATDQPIYRLLIVEDKVENRQLLVKLLAPLGFEIREAVNGQECLDIWQVWQPHLIWMDIRMPVMDGYEATRRIKATPQGKATVIIAITASVFDEERTNILRAGCDDFVRKPFREHTIFETLEQRLGVKFLYTEESNLTSVIPLTSVKEVYINQAVLAKLPAQWLDQLQDAVINIELDTAKQLLQQLHIYDAVEAKRLSNYIEEFEYDKVLTVIQHCKENV